MRHDRARTRRLQFEPLEVRRLLSATPIISEFMASNSKTLTDYYGKYPDWLEIYNPDTSSVSLSGWKLIDNSTSWSIPANVSVAAHGYMVVFCDGKDTVAPNGELHTNFKLGASGDYLALEQPDNTVVSAYSPQYPQQVADVSYGVGTSLVGAGSVVKALVPTTGSGDSLGTTWEGNPANEPFDDYEWPSGTIGAGYGVATPIASTNLKLRLNADSSSALATDTSGAGHNATNVNGAVSWVSDVTDTSASPMLRRGLMQFNAANNSQMTVPAGTSDLYNSTQGAIMFWMKSSGTTGTGDGAVLADYRSSRGILITQTDSGYVRVRCYYNGSAVDDFTSNASVSDNQWHHVAVSFDQNSGHACATYIDGVLDKSSTNTGSWSWTTTYPLEIGRTTATGQSPSLTLKNYNGLLDDFRFYTAQPTAAQISGIANGLDGGITTTDVGLNVQGQMQNVNTSAFLRIPFTVTTPSSISTLKLTMRFTDGFVAWINGQQVAAVNAPASPAWNSASTATHSPERYYTTTITVTSGLLQAGTNILAVQGMDAVASETNFLILPQLDANTITSGAGMYFATPTPGAANSAGKTNLGPIVTDVTNIVSQPTGGTSSQPLTIHATVAASLHAVSTVQIAYCIMFGSETLAPMYDDGTHGDMTAGDGIYTAQIPTTTLSAGQMLRWRVIATDTAGAQTTGPAFNDPTGSEQYYGTVAASNVSTELPMVQFFVPNYVTPTNTNNETTVDTDAGARGDLFYNGELYDNVLIRIKGSTTRYLLKRSHHIDFNSDHKFLWEVGQPRVSNAVFNSEYVDPSYARQFLAMWLYREAGVDATPDFPVRMQMNGDFWQLAFFSLPLDGSLLNVMNLDSDGALYKGCGTVNPGSPEKRTREWEDNSDYNALATAINSSRPAAERAAAIFDMLDVPQVIDYLAVARITMECDDVWANMALYRDSDGTGLWRVVPYDTNLSFGQMYAGDNPANSGIHVLDDNNKAHPLYGGSQYETFYNTTYNQLYDVIISNPVTRDMLLRRMRTLMDEFLQPPGTPYGNRVLETQLDEMAAECATEANLDRQKWGWPVGESPYGMGTPSFAQAVSDLKTQFLDPRRVHLYVDHSLDTSYPNYAGIPPQQQGGLSITFGSYDACPASGNQDEEYMTLVNPNSVAVDISGWKLSGGVNFTFEDGTVIPAGGTLYVSPNVVAFRARTTGPSGGQTLFIEGNYSGHLSMWGETVQLLDRKDTVIGTLTTSSNPSAVQQYLRITELMYHPADPSKGSTYVNDDFEFVELKNISTTQTLDLTGVRFTDGIAYDFTGSNVTSLAPGAKVLVVSNLSAFQSRYGTGLNGIIAGQYGVVTATNLDPKHFSNSGEKVTLVDSVGETVLSFTYVDDWFKQTDGSGNSLVIRDPLGDRSLWDQREGWFASHSATGSPGTDETPDYAVDAIVVNEVLSHTDITNPGDWVEFYNTTSSPINIGGWYLSNSDSNLKKYQIAAGTVIPANGYITFNHHDNFGNTADPGYKTEFSFDEFGDTVYLTSASGGVLTTYQTSQSFDANDRDQDGTYPYAHDSTVTFSFGRYIKSTGGKDFVETVHSTYNTANTAPRVGPVVVNEINYHPAPGQTAYIELKNITSGVIDLYDPNNTNPLNSSLRNAWELGGGISFSFPQGATIPASGYALVVDADPTWYRTEYSIPTSVPIYGPYLGTLNKGGDTVELLRPGEPQTPPDMRVPYYRVDQVTYDDSSPWPKSADGFGASLNRISAMAYGDDVANWTAGHPTPGGDYAALSTAPITTTTPATATPGTVTGTTTALSVVASDIQGESTIVYDWSATSMPVGATYPTFSVNDNNAAKNTTVTFYKSGNYTFTVRMADTYGGVATSSVNVTVAETITGLSILPNGALVLPSQTLQLTPIWSNQFGQPMSSQSNAPMPTWSISPTSGAGTISQQGLYTAPASSTTATIGAASGSYVATATVQVQMPTAYWKFDEGSGTTAADSSGNGRTGTLAGSCSFGPGVIGNALNLTGGGYASLPTGIVSGLNDFTIAGWVKLSSLDTWSRIFDFGTGTSNYMFLTPCPWGANTPRFAITTGSGEQQINSSIAIPANTWTHVAVTLSGNTGTLYINGAVAGTNTSMTIHPTNLGTTTQNYLGKSQFSGDPALNGSLDDMRIYNTALSAANVASLANLPPTVATAAAAAPSTVTGTTTVLSVLGADNLGESNLSYTWRSTGPAAVNFSDNGSNTAKNTTATFSKAGSYSFLVTITDQGGLSTTSPVSVTVNQTPTSLSVQSAPLAADGTVTFTATASDQFGDLLSPQPQFNWALAGGGALSAGGVFTPPYCSYYNNAGSATITATGGTLSSQKTIAYPGAAQLNSSGSFSWNGSGVWKSASTTLSTNAAPGVRGVAGDLIDFATGAGGAVALNGKSPLLAGINFADAGSYTIGPGNGGTLHLNNATAAATVNVAAAAAQTISAPLALDGNLAIAVAADGSLTLSGPLSGNGHSLAVSGPGTVRFSGPADSGLASTTITLGTLIIQNSSVLADGGSLTVGDASAFGAPAVAPSMNATVAIAGGDAVSALVSQGNASAAPLALQVVSAMPISTQGVLKNAPIAAPLASVFSGTRRATGPVAAAIPSAGKTVAASSSAAIRAAAFGRYPGLPIWLEGVRQRLTSGGQNDQQSRSLAALDAVMAQYGRP